MDSRTLCTRVILSIVLYPQLLVFTAIFYYTVDLRGTKSLSQEMIDSWKSTKMLIIDEVSFLSEHLLEKTDKHMRILKEEKDVMFGGCHVIFVGDFFQLLPVGSGQPLFKGNTLQFGAINKAIFLNISHRFDNDH